MRAYWITGALLLVWLVLSWFLGSWLGLKGSDLWFLRAGLMALGLIAAGFAFFWIYRRRKAAAEDGIELASGGAGAEDVNLLVHDAERRLRSSKLGANATLGKQPAIFLVGEAGSVKTTTVVHSGLDPELLAGHAYQDSTILPTQTANIWYTRQAVFVDCGGDLLDDPGRWGRLVKLMQPSRLSSALSRDQQAPRAVIVCYPCENFFKQGASTAAAAAGKKLNTRLQELSRLLSISFPVYVLFTKIDRVSFFAEYVQNLTPEEVREVLGATLPVRQAQAGVYADEETKRLNKIFDELFYSLADRRLSVLGRENQADRLPGIYEFPREIRKMRSLLVDFLVNLARPSQLQVNPFLRGFYFSGVRAVMVDDVAAPASRSSDLSEEVGESGATQMFNARQLRRGQVEAPVAVARSRKVPEWVFLSHLFNEVILKDRVALSASGFSSRVNLLRRIALFAIIAVCLVCMAGFAISFMGNRALEAELVDAMNQASATTLKAGQLASLSDLQHLERLRQSVATISSYENEGVPWRLRWGLYIGDRLYTPARQAYFTAFRQLLFGVTQDRLLAALRNLPNAPGPTDTYENTYNPLRAYLTTTSNHEKSTQQFLSPVLLSYWQAGKEIDAPRVALAKQQFDFYSTELVSENPFSSDNDKAAIARARLYLAKFAGIDRYYLQMINDADHSNPRTSFNREFKDTGDVLLNAYEVRGAFTKNGFAFVQTALGQPARYNSGEEWVLGKSVVETLDPARLQQELSRRYYADFINTWFAVLKSTKFVPYKDWKDAGDKLATLSSPSSPLLELFWFVSYHTNVDQTQIKDTFQPVQAVVQPGAAGTYVQPGNETYVSALAKLQQAISNLVNSAAPASDLAAIAPTQNAASDAHLVVSQVEQKFHVDPSVPVYTAAGTLLTQPIDNIQDLISRGPEEALKQGGAKLCSEFAVISRYYPFNTGPNAPDLPLAQLNQFLAPGSGTLWTFYDKSLKQFVTKEGSHYTPVPTSTVHLSPGFLNFFDRAAGLSDALYPAAATPGPTAATPPAAPAPHLNYSLKQVTSTVEGLELKIGSETLSGTGPAKPLVWTGSESVLVTENKGLGVLGNYDMIPWAVFHWVSGARISGAGSVLELEWIIQNNNIPVKLPNGKLKSYTYELQVSGRNPFLASEWGNMRCMAPVSEAKK